MRSIVVSAFVALLLIPAAAVAQGMPAFKTGVYVGVNGGIVAGNSSFDLYDWETLDEGVYGGSGAGVLAGGQAGMNVILNNGLVFGVEADGQFTTYGTELLDTPESEAIVGQKVDMLATLRARLGKLIDERTLLYATAGVALTHGNVRLFDEDGHDTDTDNITSTGLVAGAGIERMLSEKLSGKIEALVVQTKGDAHTYFEDEDEDYYAHVTFGAVIVRAGLNLHF